MRDDRPSFTALWVAACRGLGALLPEEARLVEDPLGVKLGGVERLDRVARRAPRLTRATFSAAPRLARPILYMQVRTRVLDDVLVAFARAGGRQVVLLGAGFDARAVRLRDELDGAVVYEIDHPATQARKRVAIAAAGAATARVEYLAWNFEQPTARLPAALAALGHDAARPTLTIWEGVTMYLTIEAIEQTLAAVASWSAPGSELAFTYFDRASIARPSPVERVLQAVVARVGEPFRFGWDPSELPSWLAARGFELVFDYNANDSAAALLPARWARAARHPGRHFALARRAT